jgi:membrane-bound lytic murein transglycosylase D
MQKNSRRFRLLGSALLALSLAGCVPTPPASAPPGEEPQATAPALPARTQQAEPAANRGRPQPPTSEQQRVRALIGQVEEAYSKGADSFNKGKLAEAKIDFDRAVDLMLVSGISIKSDDQLQEEFDRIVDAVNALEMEALKQGNGFVAKTEPSPADVAADVTFEVDPNLVAKAQADLATTKSDLPLVVNDYVAAYINFFANTQRGHYTLLHSFQRAGRYKTMIEKVMAEEGVPQDLIYLAVAESSFQPRALNGHSGAGGMWQFMPHGDYGLARTGYVDERFDPEKSTRAYARYMKFIYNQLGDWYLSMAAYDWGAGNVQHAVQKTGYADYWELYKRNNLPAETKAYVPEILAAIIIANHPKQYGFDDVTLDPAVQSDTVTVNYSVDLRLVADLVGTTMDELTALNPSLLRNVTPPDAPFDLHLPAGTGAQFTQRVAEIPEGKRNSWRYHRVNADDSLASVAHAYRVTVADLAAANRLQESDKLDGVEALVVPVSPAAAPSTRSLVYTTHKGDTLVTIADRFGVSLVQLRQWNKLKGLKVEPGRRLRVGESANVPHGSRKHRRGTSETRAASGERSHEPAASKGAKGKSTASRSGRKRAASPTREKSASGRKPASGAKKKSAPAEKKHAASKPAAHGKSSKSKRK